MPENPDHDAQRLDGVEPAAVDGSFVEVGESAFEAESAFAEVVLGPSDDDVALVAELAELDRADREAGLLDDLDTAGPAPWDEAVVSDDELVASLGRGMHEADLMLLASIDPRDLSENLVRVDYLRALDRISARVASMRHAAVVAMVGPTSSEAYLPEVALEHEISVPNRNHRHPTTHHPSSPAPVPAGAPSRHAGDRAGVEHAELVAFRIEHDRPRVGVRECPQVLSHLDEGPSRGDESCHLVVEEAVGGDVEMHSVLHRLRLGDTHEVEGCATRRAAHLVLACVALPHGATEDGTPPVRLGERI